MDSVIGPVIIGLFIVILGVNNMKGNISSLHSYHRKRVTKEDRLPFGRLIGAGTIICGVALIILGCLAFVAEQTGNAIFTLIGSVIVVVGFVLGLGLSFYAMIKYNKGIF